jgi:hypothetical protein
MNRYIKMAAIALLIGVLVLTIKIIIKKKICEKLKEQKQKKGCNCSQEQKEV